MNISLRSPRVLCGPLALIAALVCALAFTPGSAFASSLTGPTGTVDIGSADIGSSTTARIPLTGSGCGALSVSSSNPDFALDYENFSFVGGSCDFQLTMLFTPAVVGTETGTLTVTDGSGDSVQIQVTGDGVAPAISVDQPSVNFGSATIGSPLEDTLTVTNTGGEDLNVGQATLGGANPGQFAITADTCSGGTVAGGGLCTIGVQYDPTARAAQTAELDIPSNDPNTPTEAVELSGTGLLPATVSPDRTSNDFGAVTVGQNSATTFTVTNTGDRPLSIRQVSLGGANAGQFAIVSNTCPVAQPLAIVQPATPPGIPAGGTCTISVQFNPTAVGAQAAELDITKSGAGTPTVITLSGTGAAVTQPAPPAPPTKPVQPTQPTPQPKLIAQVSNLGQPAGAQQLLSGGEKERVYCNQACSLNVTLEVYYRAIARGKHYRGLLHAQTVRTQPWTRVNVGQATMKMTAAGYEVVSVKVAAHKQVVADAGSILLGVYTHSGNTLVSKHWMQVKGPDMNALVQALNSQS